MATVPALLGTPHQAVPSRPKALASVQETLVQILVKGIKELTNKTQQPPAAGAFQGPGPGQGTEVLGPASRRRALGTEELQAQRADLGPTRASPREGLPCAGPQSCCLSRLSLGRDSVEGPPRAWRYVNRGWTWRMRQQWRGGGGEPAQPQVDQAHGPDEVPALEHVMSQVGRGGAVGTLGGSRPLSPVAMVT